ncbi:HAD-IA family hydrolase [Rhodococcus sp. 14-2470-1a]|uniref:HAD-IA family hydrolase n=1 Tax=Rhodococcus sp. 14-2470-1a TaxID=2023150 RepID=UPI000B9C4B36|nr:HAD-IA family hydrolase [Rhodococcus sp. 14-2470-1a]OZF42069.1 hypothetical protein CH292_26615 [Rhodococcus sp. 14-2470-1a]
MNTRIASPHRETTRLTVSTGNYRTDAAAVIFDLDGVLVDSHPQIDRALQQWAHSRDVDLRTWRQEAHALTDPEFIALVAPHLDMKTETDALRSIEYSLAGTTRAHRGAQQTYGKIPHDLRCIVTSGSRSTVLRRINSAKLPSPRILVAAEDVRYGKPHPEPYLLALEHLRASATEVVVVEDSPAGARAARAAGLAVIGIAETESIRQNLLEEAVVDCIPDLSFLTVTPRSSQSHPDCEGALPRD